MQATVCLDSFLNDIREMEPHKVLNGGGAQVDLEAQWGGGDCLLADG